MTNKNNLQALIQQAVNAQQAGQMQVAIDLYERALGELPKEEKNLLLHLKLGFLYSHMGETKKTLTHYHAALQIDPASLQAHYQLGLHFLRNQAFEYAIIQFKNVLALDDNFIDAYLHLGVAYFHTQQLQKAQTCFERVLKSNPEDVEAYVNLGAIAMAEQKGQQAIDHFTRALSLDAEHETSRSNLAATFMHFNRYENALTHYLLLLEKFPDNIDYIYQAALCEMTLGQLDSARKRFLSILQKQPENFSVLYNLAILSMRLNQKEEAKTFLSSALLIQPDDASSRHLLASLSGGKSNFAEGIVHAQRLFDQYAMYYDNHMIGTLSYQVPFIIMTMLKRHEIFSRQRILDLGCGTGLCGELLITISQHIIGVDISKPMLERAQEKGCYEQCIVKEATAFLNETTLTFDLIVAADLFPYFGDLKPCFEGIKRCLEPGGYVIFTVEKTEVTPWVLQDTARYAHQVDYVKGLCLEVGLEVQACELETARQQNGKGLMVWVFLLRG